MLYDLLCNALTNAKNSLKSFRLLEVCMVTVSTSGLTCFKSDRAICDLVPASKLREYGAQTKKKECYVNECFRHSLCQNVKHFLVSNHGVTHRTH